MAEMVKLPVRAIVNAGGKTLKCERLDADGEVVYTKNCALCGHVEEDAEFHPGKHPFKADMETMPMTTLQLIRQVCYGIGTKIRKTDDAQYVHSAMTRVLAATGREQVRLPKETYDWMQRVLTRLIPLSKEEIEENAQIEKYNATVNKADERLELIKPRTFADAMWNVHAYVISKQLTVGGIAVPVGEEEEEEAVVS